MNIGIEDLKIIRDPNTAAYAYNINFNSAINCWVRGVESYKPSRSHLAASRSSHLEISGCYFHEAMGYGSDGWGYGVSLGESTTNSLVVNNIFRCLRHSLVAAGGSNCNVWTFNYSREQHSTGLPPTYRDLDFHAKYPFGHLFEHNVIEEIGADDCFGDNGPYNALVRNHCYDGGVSITTMEDWSTLGNIKTKSGSEIYTPYHTYDHPPIKDRWGYRFNYQQYGTHNEFCYYPSSGEGYELRDVSYYYSARPSFLPASSYTWPTLGPDYYSTQVTQSIPAKDRFNATKKTYLPNPTPKPLTYSGNLPYSQTWSSTHPITGNITVPSGVQLTILGGTTINFSGSSYITVQPGGSIVASSPITFNPGDRSVRYSGTISVNNTWAFPVLMTNNVTVNSGKMLTILPGSLIKVYSGKKLTVNGAISASGTASQKITFQANNGTWYGIEVNYSGNTAFNYCNIKNATCGIRGYQTSNLTLDHCEMTNNTNGVTYTNQSSGYVRYSKINSNMGNSGINCAQNSNPIIRPNNQLKYNTPAGLYGDYNSLPEMGSWANNGNNSISNSYDDVWSENSNSLYALYNYWGSSSPNPSISDNIEWEPYLTSDPNGGSLNKLLAENPGTAERDTIGQTEFAKAYQAYLKEDYALAIPLFQEIVQKYPDHANGEQALGLINQCYQKTEKNTAALSYLEQVQSSFTAKKVSQLARSIAVGHHVRQGDYATAIANCEQILTASTDSVLTKYALYDLGTIYWYFQHDPKTGEKYYRQLIEIYPKDQLTQSALATLGETTPDTQHKPQPAHTAAVVTDHLTLQTFPNPFNPVTAIQFNLPEAGQVTITIYDLQGRQIARLLDEPREAGLQIVHWNVQNDFGVPTASGTYFCQLRFKNQVLNQKIILVK